MGERKDSTSHLGTVLASSEVFELAGCGCLSAAYPGLEARMEPLASARWVQAISFRGFGHLCGWGDQNLEM